MFDLTSKTRQETPATLAIGTDGTGLAEAVKAIAALRADETVSLTCGAIILDVAVDRETQCYTVNSRINNCLSLKDATGPAFGLYSRLLEFPAVIVEPCQLRPGSLIQIGDVELRLPNHILSSDPFLKLRAASTCFVFGELLAAERHLLRTGQTMHGEYCSLIDQGYHNRKSNQDVAGARITPDGRSILVVSDGMGGYGGGDYAALCVTRHTLDQTQQGISLAHALMAAPIVLEQRFYFDRLPEEYRGMGACVVGADIKQNEATIAHIGDTRAYVIRPGDPPSLVYRSHDHSQLQEARDRGEINDTESRSFRYRNVVNRCVLIGQPSQPTVVTLAIQEGDILILCTDGLWENLHDSEIVNLVKDRTDSRQIAEALHEAALCEVISSSAANGGGKALNDDNIGLTVYVHHL